MKIAKLWKRFVRLFRLRSNEPEIKPAALFVSDSAAAPSAEADDINASWLSIPFVAKAEEWKYPDSFAFDVLRSNSKAWDFIVENLVDAESSTRALRLVVGETVWYVRGQVDAYLIDVGDECFDLARIVVRNAEVFRNGKKLPPRKEVIEVPEW